MSKEFNVPPIVFPSGGNPGPSPTIQRRPTMPFQPHPSPNPIPFMSFDIGPTTTSFPAPQFGSSNSLSNFDDEPLLLEELGINTKQIWTKTTSILKPFRSSNPNLHDNTDLSGPVLCLVMFGLFQLLAEKIILGWLTVSALFLYVVFNMLVAFNGNLDLYRCFQWLFCKRCRCFFLRAVLRSLAWRRFS